MFVSAHSSTVNNMVKEVRSLSVVTTLYRTLTSLTALAAIAGVRHGGTPLDGMAFMCDALAIPSGWTNPVSSWVSERAEPVGGVAQILLTVGLLALPKRRRIGWDLAQTLEWRAPSTTAMSFAVLVQCGYGWHALLLIGLFAVWGIWEIRRGNYRYDASDHVLVAVGSILLAVTFAPLFAFVWFFARDARNTSYIPDDS